MDRSGTRISAANNGQSPYIPAYSSDEASSPAAASHRRIPRTSRSLGETFISGPLPNRSPYVIEHACLMRANEEMPAVNGGMPEVGRRVARPSAYIVLAHEAIRASAQGADREPFLHICRGMRLAEAEVVAHQRQHPLDERAAGQAGREPVEAAQETGQFGVRHGRFVPERVR